MSHEVKLPRSMPGRLRPNRNGEVIDVDGLDNPAVLLKARIRRRRASDRDDEGFGILLGRLYLDAIREPARAAGRPGRSSVGEEGKQGARGPGAVAAGPENPRDVLAGFLSDSVSDHEPGLKDRAFGRALRRSHRLKEGAEASCRGLAGRAAARREPPGRVPPLRHGLGYPREHDRKRRLEPLIGRKETDDLGAEAEGVEVLIFRLALVHFRYRLKADHNVALADLLIGPLKLEDLREDDILGERRISGVVGDLRDPSALRVADASEFDATTVGKDDPVTLRHEVNAGSPIPVGRDDIFFHLI